jgi:hypothetical protein
MFGNGQPAPPTTFEQEFEKAWNSIDWAEILGPIINPGGSQPTQPTQPEQPAKLTPPIVPDETAETAQELMVIDETDLITSQPSPTKDKVIPWLILGGATALLGKKLFPWALGAGGAYLLLNKKGF